MLPEPNDQQESQNMIEAQKSELLMGVEAFRDDSKIRRH